MNFYKHHIGDFDQATRHLSFVEDAAYCRMIRKYYAEECPLPKDLKKIQRLIGARTKEERAAVEMVLEEFFVLEDDGYHQVRCDEELEAAWAKADVNRRVGKLGGRPRKTETQTEPTNNPDGFLLETQTVSENNPSQTPDTRHQTPDLKPVAASPDASGPLNARPAELSAAMRRNSIEAQPGDPRIIAAAEAGISVATVEAACAEAKASDPTGRIKPGFVLKIAERWTADAAKPRAQARASPQRPANHHDERAHTIAVLTGRSRDDNPDEPYTIDAAATRIG